MNYRLPSLHLGTTFDRSVHRLGLPGVAARGDSPSLVILDGASRAPRRLARVARPAALIGLQVERPSGPVLVRVNLLVDEISTSMWRQSQLLSEEELPSEEGRHRAVRVSLQGRTRAVVVLDRRTTDGDASVQRLSFRVEPEELGEVGLLTLSLDLPGDLPPWLQARVLPDGLAGVCVGRVSIRPLDTEVDPSLSTGRTPQGGRHLVARRPGGLIVNPGESGVDARLLLSPRALSPRPRPIGRQAVVKEPAARLRDLTLRAAHRLSPERVAVEVQAVDHGRNWTERVSAGADGRYELRIPAHDLPAYVRPVSTHRLGGDWYARASRCENVS